MTNGGRDAQPGVAVDTKVDTAVDKAVDGEQPGIRERLARAAFVQFTDRGFDATTVDQIADAAGVSRRTFFRYFKTKEDAIFPAHDRLRASVAAISSVVTGSRRWLRCVPRSGW